MEVGTSVLLEICAVHESLFGTKRTCRSPNRMSAFGGRADVSHGVFYEYTPLVRLRWSQSFYLDHKRLADLHERFLSPVERRDKTLYLAVAQTPYVAPIIHTHRGA